MAAYNDLINYIKSIVKANANEEITGTNMQAVLLQIVDIIGSPQFRGVASTVTDPGTPIGHAIYITASDGIYHHFADIEVEPGEIALLKWTGSAWVKESITSVVSDVFVRDSNVPFVQRLLQLKGSHEEEITLLQKPNGIVSGGIVTWSGEGLTFNISLVIYLINNLSFIIPAGEVTLDPADPDNKRKDVIAVDDTGSYIILKGEADGLNVKPQVDSSMIELTSIEVGAGAITPTVNELIIYNENTESIGTSTSLTANFDDTAFPRVGIKDVKVTAVTNNSKLTFTLAEPVAIAQFSSLSFFIRLNQIIPPDGKIYVQFYNGITAVSDELAVTIDKSLLHEYQFIAIAMNTFRFTGESFDNLQIKYKGTAMSSGFYLDFIRLTAGIEIPAFNNSVVLTGDVDGHGTTGVPIQTDLKAVHNKAGIYGSSTKSAKVTIDNKGRVVDISEEDIIGGQDGDTPYIGVNGNWWIGTTDTGVQAEGIDGVDGVDGSSAFVYIAYASDANGTGFTMTFNGLLNFIAIKTTTTPIAEPQASDFAGLWKQYAGIAPTIGPHYTYVAWCDTPDPENTLGFTLVPNLTLPFEAILITHTEIAEPTAADFVGLWRPRVTATDVYDKWNLLVDDDETPQQPITDNTTVYFKRGEGIDLSGYKDFEGRQVIEIKATSSGGSTNLTAIPTLDQTASGITTDMVANEAQAFGDVVRINSAGKAQIAKADVIANATALAMCVDETILADAVGKYLLLGFVRNDAWDFTIGEWIYLSLVGTTGNTLTQENPAANAGVIENNVIQLLGVANSADSFYFNPQLVQVEWKPADS